jgi:hypothetical protein
MGAVRKAAIGGVAGLALLGGIFSTEIKQVVAPDVIFGDEVRVRLYRGLGGRAFDRATDNFGLEARKRCGVRYYVAGQAGTDTSALAANSAVRKAKKVVLVGTSMGGKKARDTAEALAPQKVDLLLVDTVPWTGAIPANVVNQVTWRNTWPFQLGGGKPQGTKDDRPRAGTHGGVIHALRTHEEVVDEICRGITHPSKRK